MALTLNTTLSDRLSNSYVDVAYCDDYWTGHYSATKAAQWLALSSQQKVTLLISACRVIETARFTMPFNIIDYHLKYDFRTQTVLDMTNQREPVRWYAYQNLQFPRNLDINLADGSRFIPENVLAAQCEQAIYLLNFDESALSSRMQGIVNDTVSIGKGQIHLNQEYTSQGSTFAPMALELVRPLLVTSIKLRRG